MHCPRNSIQRMIGFHPILLYNYHVCDSIIFFHDLQHLLSKQHLNVTTKTNKVTKPYKKKCRVKVPYEVVVWVDGFMRKMS
jgi:hypothetical protein